MHPLFKNMKVITMKKHLAHLLMALGLGLSVTALTGCEEKGPFEKAGENMDEAAEEVADEIDDHTTSN